MTNKRNFKKKKKLHPGKLLRQKLWAIATSSSQQVYEAAMVDMKEYDNSAYDWVKKIAETKHWVTAFVTTHTQSDMIVNNLCESFNGHIWEARTKAYLEMFGRYKRTCDENDSIKAILDEKI